MASTATETVEEHEWATRPECAPAPGTRRALVRALLAASLAVGAGFALAGAWMARPFAGPALALQLTLLFLALHSLQQSTAPRQSIRIQYDRLIVASGRAARPGKPFRLPGPASALKPRASPSPFRASAATAPTSGI